MLPYTLFNALLVYKPCNPTYKLDLAMLKPGWGTKSSISMDLVQGSGAASTAWTAVSSSMVSTYKCKGYGAALHADGPIQN